MRLNPGSSALTLVENNQSGIHNTTHTAVDEYGNIFGFRFDGIYNNGDIEIVDPNTGKWPDIDRDMRFRICNSVA